ncbi:ABC transporter ATP-binding protein [Sphingomonas japonica]|uniref:Iron complex transport system ATP-binding protein n=1 Tax=Sphingomonas japonica TaxID=511662 RepID=A0ABX0TZH5_9SPHN|nr:ABC transporter ATP-binding protein [Sphingomonas japonica]NIJ22567.1 iron complex transport system ATP-binding protein [Sphingomonas japonica]
MTAILQLARASVTIGATPILTEIDATFDPGRITVILGPNGAGKSTLLSLLVGLRAPDRGAAMLGDRPIAGIPAIERGRRIGYLPQSAELHWDLEVRDLVALGRTPRRGRFGALSPADDAAIDRALAETDTERFAHRRAGSLSGGERARVLLARVLAGEPDWILADEPLASLDPAHRIEVLTALQNVAASGTGVVLVLHDLTLAHWVADDVLLLDRGRVVAAGSNDILTEPGLIERVYGIAVDRIDRAGQPPLIVPVPRLHRDGAGG